MPVLNRQLYISYTNLFGSAPYPVSYGYVCWVTEDPDPGRLLMPGLPEPISGQVATLGVVETVRRAANLSLTTTFTGSEFAAEIPTIPTPGGISAAITGNASPAVVGTTFTASEGGWFGRVNSAGAVLPIQGYSYQWRRDGAPISPTPPAGNTYTAVGGDVGTEISCAISAITFGEAISSGTHITNSIAVT
jgi:hypothetical protein